MFNRASSVEVAYTNSESIAIRNHARPIPSAPSRAALRE